MIILKFYIVHLSFEKMFLSTIFGYKKLCCLLSVECHAHYLTILSVYTITMQQTASIFHQNNTLHSLTLGIMKFDNLDSLFQEIFLGNKFFIRKIMLSTYGRILTRFTLTQ